MIVTPERVVTKGTARKGGGAAVFLVAQENADEAVREVVGDFVQSRVLSGADGTFHFKLVAVVLVILMECLNQQVVDGEPDGTAPVGIATKQAAPRVAGLVLHCVGIPINFHRHGLV